MPHTFRKSIAWSVERSGSVTYLRRCDEVAALVARVDALLAHARRWTPETLTSALDLELEALEVSVWQEQIVTVLERLRVLHASAAAEGARRVESRPAELVAAMALEASRRRT
jgi:hypothetical protein